MGVYNVSKFVLYVSDYFKGHIKDEVENCLDMSDINNSNFHNFALHSFLFKGRPDLYFCYLKSEKLSHALFRIARNTNAFEMGVFETLLRTSALLPGAVTRFAAGEFEEASLLADVFEILSLVRLCVSSAQLSEENGMIIVSEYEQIAEKVSLGKNASPFLSLDDLTVPSLSRGQEQEKGETLGPGRGSPAIKDIRGVGYKGQNIKDKKQVSDRAMSIMKVITEKKRVSIKDISRFVRGCSEKTIQRELNVLIQHGLVRKEGERRWSVYLPIK